MAWALVAIVILSVGVPIGAWIYTRLRPLPPASRLGAGYDSIDKWLLQRHSLPPLDRERVRAAVFHGRQVPDPALASAEHDFAANALAGRGWRQRRTDYEFLISPQAHELLQQERIAVIDYRPIQQAWSQPSAPP